MNDSEIIFKNKVYEVTNSIAELLITKNRKYGNSALEPINIFNDQTPYEKILTRIDIKLERIKANGLNGDIKYDSLNDLISYLLLLKLAN